MEIEAGDPLILKDAKGLKKYGLVKGMKGACNGVTAFEGDETYISFMPDGAHKIFVINANRLELDKEKILQIKAEESESSDA